MKITKNQLKHLIREALSEQSFFDTVEQEKWTSAGGVVIKPSKKGFQVLLVAPSGQYGGYSWTFPKGQVDDGESNQQAALREVEEEAGIAADILPNGYLGEYEGTSSFTHYFVMIQKGEQGETDFETEDSSDVLLSQAQKMVNPGRDKKVLKDLKGWLDTHKNLFK